MKGRSLSDEALRSLLIEDPEQGWRAFVDEYTPVLLALIERAGITERDEAMDVYLRACERLAADDCARLRRHDRTLGSLSTWLGVVVQHVVVDWVRSRAGRRRLFRSIKGLSPFDQRVFELFYWHERSAPEIAQLAGGGSDPSVSLGQVLDALDRIDRALTDRQRSELLSLAARRPPVALEDEHGLRTDAPDSRPDPEHELRIKQNRELLAAALRELPAEDALIVSMKYVDGLSNAQVQRALHLESVTSERVRAILERLRSALAARGIAAAAATESS